jgi:hypothetical protein
MAGRVHMWLSTGNFGWEIQLRRRAARIATYLQVSHIMSTHTALQIMPRQSKEPSCYEIHHSKILGTTKKHQTQTTTGKACMWWVFSGCPFWSLSYVPGLPPSLGILVGILRSILALMSSHTESRTQNSLKGQNLCLTLEEHISMCLPFPQKMFQKGITKTGICKINSSLWGSPK